MPKYQLKYHQKERGQGGRHFYQKIPLGYQGKYQRAQNVVGKSSRVSTRMPLWQASPRTSGQVHCSSLPSCSLDPADALFTLHTVPLFHYHGSSAVLYFYPSFQLLHVGWVGSSKQLAARWHAAARATLEKFSTPTHYCLASVTAVASVHFSS